MCTEEVQAVLLALGTYFPNMLLAGKLFEISKNETNYNEDYDRNLRLDKCFVCRYGVAT